LKDDDKPCYLFLLVLEYTKSMIFKGVLWIGVELCDRSNVLGRAFSPAAFAQSFDCWPDLSEPFGIQLLAINSGGARLGRLFSSILLEPLALRDGLFDTDRLNGKIIR
jgi:hypothetical protein